MIKNPFGRNDDAPAYLGATTPMVGSAVRKLSLAADGTLFADVWDYEPNLDMFAPETFALYTWNAPALVQGALNAYQRDPKHTYPIDRNLPTNPNAQAPLIPELTPSRYDTVSSAGTFVGWSNLGSYPEPGEFPTFAPRTTPQQALVFTRLEEPVPISEQQTNTMDGYLLKAFDMFTAGFATKVGDNNYKYGTGQISLSQAVFLNLIEVATTTAAFAVSGAVASGVKVTLTE
ncbi:MAG: hypothetical protein JNM98_09550, partial [Rhodocyclaceae bacterium]|nr:hypothetical protein [Rhodocyclaceae bacterium]